MKIPPASVAVVLPLVLLFLVPVLATARAPRRASADGAGAGSAAAALRALFDEEWDYWMRDDPTWASQLGDRRRDDRWPERTLASYEQRREHERQVLERLHAIDRDALSADDQLNRDLFERHVSERVEELGFRLYLMPVDQRGGLQTDNELSESLRFETVKDYENWIARLRAFGTYADQTMGLMQEGLRVGIVQPRILMDRVPGQLAHQLVSDPEKSPYYRPLASMPEAIGDADRARLRSDAARAIREVVVPAYERFKKFFDESYRPGSRATIAARDLPDGDRIYAWQVRHHTTTDLTPLQVHDIGLSEVARIRKQMDAIIAQVGFKGDFPAFLQYLRTDPRFYAKDAADLFMRYEATSKRIDPELVRLFGRLPRMPYGVRAIPEESAPDTTTAYYNGPAADGSRAGTYYVNLYKPEVRPLYEMMALSLHEAVPGHHLQIALAQELGELPAFRRHTGYTAYVEGWGLYAESLGDEMGLYDDPYSKFGQLTYEMWRAVRLVVDTGMHALGWDRQRAIDFFKANAAKTELDIVNEIDRYIGWPGQALAYKVGELKIKELRHRAEAALGDRFDVRAFHDVVLGSGAVPLDVLERGVDDWIAQGGGAASPAAAPRRRSLPR